MTTRQADALLLFGIGARSTSYVFAKTGLATLTPWTLLGFRFALAFLILSLLFHRHLRQLTRKTCLASILLGVVLFLCMSCETISLQTIPSSMSSFLENTAVVWVFIIQAIFARKLPPLSLLAALGCILVGIFLLTLHGTTITLTTGIAIAIAGSICYACWIILTEKFAHDVPPLPLGILQMGVIAFLSFSSELVTTGFHVPTTTTEWYIIITLAIVCSVIGFTVQPIAQKYTSVEKAGLFTPLNPVIAFFLGWIFLSEAPSIAQVIGGVLIIGTILYVQLHKQKTK